MSGKTIDEIQELLYEEHIKNGYKEMWSAPLMPIYGYEDFCYRAQNIFDLAEVGLINTEISEALECIRKDCYNEKLYLEMADIIIRAINFCSRKGIKISSYIENKNTINLNRGELHGKKV